MKEEHQEKHYRSIPLYFIKFWVSHLTFLKKNKNYWIVIVPMFVDSMVILFPLSVICLSLVMWPILVNETKGKAGEDF
jgi:hypothetical protein